MKYGKAIGKKKSPPKLFPCWKTLVKNFTSRSGTCICYLLDICTWIYYRYHQPQYVPKLEWSKVWFATYSLSLCCCPNSTNCASFYCQTCVRLDNKWYGYLTKRNSCPSFSNLLPCLQIASLLMFPFPVTGTIILPVAQSGEEWPSLTKSCRTFSRRTLLRLPAAVLLPAASSPAWATSWSFLTGLPTSGLASLRLDSHSLNHKADHVTSA